MDADIPYLLLTPGPLTTTRTVHQAMMFDYSTWDVDYNTIVQEIRSGLVNLATTSSNYTSILMQGSGTFGVEATIGSVIPPGGKLMVISNGAYGNRIARIAERLGIKLNLLEFPETQTPDLNEIEKALKADPDVTHVAVVHCETTTGILNPAKEIGKIVHEQNRSYILDAMSSFGGIPISMEDFHIDYLISSANKCVQGVPGFSFVIADQELFEKTEGWARSLSLDLFSQWKEMEAGNGKWRYTSPTHSVLAFAQAMKELDDEGGIEKRFGRYCENQERLVSGMNEIGFQALIDREFHSPIITSFLFPSQGFEFSEFYNLMKERRFVLYPGKVTDAETFRIGTIGNVFPEDIDLLLRMIQEVREMMNLSF